MPFELLAERGGVRLAGLDFGGDGPPALLLHGLAGYAGEWAETAGWLTERCRVVALDARGHGRSERLPPDVSRGAHVADAVFAVERLGLGAVVVVGQSLGGQTALLLAAARPDLVRVRGSRKVQGLSPIVFGHSVADSCPMNLYAIRRRDFWNSAEDLQQTAARSAEVGEEMADDVRWIRSYVVAEDSGRLGTICIYEGTSPEKVREHADRAGMVADEITLIVDTVIVRPDPVPAEARP